MLHRNLHIKGWPQPTTRQESLKAAPIDISKIANRKHSVCWIFVQVLIYLYDKIIWRVCTELFFFQMQIFPFQSSILLPHNLVTSPEACVNQFDDNNCFIPQVCKMISFILHSQHWRDSELCPGDHVKVTICGLMNLTHVLRLTSVDGRDRLFFNIQI